MPFEGFAACKPYGLHIFLADIHKTVVPYCSTLHLHGPFTASVVVIYIFEHLHTRIVMFHNKYASHACVPAPARFKRNEPKYITGVLRNALRMFFSPCVCPNKHLTRMLFHLKTRGGVKLQ